jgi:ribulose-5-phosphate 4-epimerase/fuculose-1-phosphate aldolase
MEGKMAEVASIKRSVKDRVSSDEWQTRVTLAACYRLVAHHGWNDGIFNHISARVPGPEGHYLINPFGLYFDEITASCLVKVDLDGKILSNETGLGINIGGYVIHGAVHAAREDAHCVIHLHTTEGVAVSGQKDGLLPLNQDSLSLVPDIAYHDYEGFALDTDERKRLIANIGDKNTVILRNHGLLTLGISVPSAFLRMSALQKACAIQVSTLAGGVEINFPSDDVQAKVREQVSARRSNSGDSPIVRLSWEGLIRKLDKLDASYKN